MRYLHDRSGLARELVPPTVTAHGRATPDHVDRELWRVLAGPPALEACGDPDDPAGFWSRLAIVASAAHSQFDALATASLKDLKVSAPVAALAGVSPAFRGFHERTWISYAGNLHLTAVVPLPSIDARSGAMLTVLPALAARDAIIAASGGSIAPRIKWVNDLYLGVGKVGGVLTRSQVQGTTIQVVVLGLGINVAGAPRIEPTPFVPFAARLEGVSLADLLHAVLDALAQRFEELRILGAGSLLDAYRSASSVLGCRVRVYADRRDDKPCTAADWPAPMASGVVTAIHDDLSLALDGVETPIASGRLAFEEDCLAYGLAPA